MPRTYTKSGHSERPVDALDWELMARLADLFAPYGKVRFSAWDDRGSYGSEDDLAAFRQEVESQDVPPKSVEVGVSGYPGDRYASAGWGGEDYWPEFSATSSDEAFVAHVASRVPVLFDLASDRYAASHPVETTDMSEEASETRPAPRTQKSPSRLRRFLYDPWTVRVGGGLAVAGIIALIVWLR